MLFRGGVQLRMQQRCSLELDGKINYKNKSKSAFPPPCIPASLYACLTGKIPVTVSGPESVKTPHPHHKSLRACLRPVPGRPHPGAPPAIWLELWEYWVLEMWQSSYLRTALSIQWHA